MTDFETFWLAFPRKTGKLDAIRKYERARSMASAEEILAGVERYKANKPEYADWCHPSTFLFQGRWMDEPDTIPAISLIKKTANSLDRFVSDPTWVPIDECPHDRKCFSRGVCQAMTYAAERQKFGKEKAS